ncbi:MAG: alpha/beta fold hydrolase, partial [Gammaproteobacteria bacterium]
MSSARLAHVQLGRAPGEGPPVVILHGLFGSGSNWRSVGRTLGAHFCVYLVDLRNHGASEHSRGMHYAELAADVLVWTETH